MDHAEDRGAVGAVGARGEVVLPDYGRSLAGVLPEVVEALSTEAVARSVVVLADGLGDHQLRERSGHAPFLRTLLPTGRVLDSGYPSTTVTSTGTFGTGRPPGSHGLVGYRVRDPETRETVDGLAWHDGPVPEVWQPHPTCFEQASAAGITVRTVAPRAIIGSGLSRATLRGASMVRADRPHQRVEAVLDVLRAEPRILVYLYWPEVDKVGHVHGPGSWQWGEAVEELDAAVRDIARAFPRGTGLSLTSDHGMVEIDPARRLDLADEPELRRDVEMAGGEMRAPQLYCRPGTAAAVAQRWRSRLEDDAVVRLRDEAIAEGWFGPVEDRVRPRIGDVVMSMRGRAGIADSRTMRSTYLALRGHHGALTPQETKVPLLRMPI